MRNAPFRAFRRGRGCTKNTQLRWGGGREREGRTSVRVGMLALREVRLRLLKDRSERTGILYVPTQPRPNPFQNHNTKFHPSVEHLDT